MAKATLAIAAAFLVALTTLACAQAPSYESRGYGGPLYVGPNFQAGGQHSPPVYGTTSKRHKKRVYRATKSHKARETKQTEQAKTSPANDDTKSENSSISRASDGAPDSGKAETAGVQNENSSIAAGEISTGSASNGKSEPVSAPRNVGCKKYFPTAGMTLSVPCD